MKLNTITITILLVGVLLSGCLETAEVTKTEVHQRYEVLDYNINVAMETAEVVYLDNNSIKTVNFYIMDELTDSTPHIRSVVLVLDNNIYLQKEYTISEPTFGGICCLYSDWYSLHITKEQAQNNLIQEK